VCQQLPECDRRVGCIWARRQGLRCVLVKGSVQIQFAVLDLLHHRQRGEQFGDRSAPEHVIRAGFAETALVDRLLIIDQRDIQPGDLPFAHLVAHRLFEARELFAFRGARRRPQKKSEQTRQRFPVLLDDHQSGIRQNLQGYSSHI
jgi:hypothetical protein